MTRTKGEARDVIDVLGEEEDAIAALSAQLEAPAARSDHVRRAALGMELVDRVTLFDAARAQMLHPILAESGAEDVARELEDRAAQRRPLLDGLGEMTSGVSARDVHVADGAPFDEALESLRRQVGEDIDFERRRVTPLLREKVAQPRRAEMGATALKALRPLDQGGKVARGLHSAVDRVKNFADTPHHSERLE